MGHSNIIKDNKAQAVKKISLPKFMDGNNAQIISPTSGEQGQVENNNSVLSEKYIDNYSKYEVYEKLIKQQQEIEKKNAYELGFNNGKAEGLEIGTKQGIEQGTIEGIKVGQHNAKQEFGIKYQEHEKKLEEAVDNILNEVRKAYDQLKNLKNHYNNLSIEIIKMIVDSILEYPSENEAYHKIESIVNKALEAAVGKEKLEIKLNHEMKEKISQKIELLSSKKGFNGTIDIIEDDNMSLMECHVNWNSGGIDFNNHNIIQNIDILIKNFLSEKLQDLDISELKSEIKQEKSTEISVEIPENNTTNNIVDGNNKTEE